MASSSCASSSADLSTGGDTYDSHSTEIKEKEVLSNIKKWEDEVSWLYHAKVTVIPIVKYAIKTFHAQKGVERHKDIKIPRCSNKTCIASNFLDTVLHTTAHIKFLDFLVQQPGNSAVAEDWHTKLNLLTVSKPTYVA